MWLTTTQGFYSVVADREDDERLLVRARAREDIEALRAQIPGIDPWQDRSADYRWRASVTRAEWTVALALLASEIEYPNFKSEVARRDPDRASIYSSVWAELLRIQRD